MTTSIAASPKILVLLATYNGRAWINEQVESILSQTSIDIQIVARDDGSTDGTHLTLSEIAKTTNKLTTLSSSSRLGSASRNFFELIRHQHADGYEMIAFADQDDIWNPEKCLRAYSAIKQTGSDLYSSATIAFWNDGHQKTLTQSSKVTSNDYLFEGAGQGCTFAVSPKLYNLIRGFLIDNPDITRNIHYHDWAIYALSRTWNLQWVYDPIPSLRYRQHYSNDTGARNSIGGLKKRLSLLSNGWYEQQLVAIAELVNKAHPLSTQHKEWLNILSQPKTLRRTYKVASTCLYGGRRRLTDRALLLAATALGWI